MKVLVTGASGFIGSHVTRALLQRGHQVGILAVPGDPISRLQGVKSRFKTIHANLEDVDLVARAVRECQPQACIHLAWYAEPGKYLHSKKNVQSLSSSLSLFQALIEAGCNQIVAAGTCLEYDTDFGYLREDTPTRPKSLYGAAKLSCCLIGSQLAIKAGTSFAWSRIFYPYGPREDARRLIPSAIAALTQHKPFQATAGEQIRDYIHVADVASAFCTLMERRAEGVYNISSGIPVTIHQLLKIIGQEMDRTDLIKLGALSYRAWEPQFVCGDNRRLKKLGWTTSLSLHEGLCDMIRSTLNRFEQQENLKWM